MGTGRPKKSQEKVQTEHLERVKQGINPTTAGWPGMIGYLPDQTNGEPNVQKTMICSKQRQGFKLKASGGSHMFDQQFQNQLERYDQKVRIYDASKDGGKSRGSGHTEKVHPACRDLAV